LLIQWYKAVQTDHLGSVLQQKIDHIDGKQQRWGFRRYVEATQDADSLLDCYRQIESLFRRLQVSGLPLPGVCNG
jgi:hypothetical protein